MGVREEGGGEREEREKKGEPIGPTGTGLGLRFARLGRLRKPNCHAHPSLSGVKCKLSRSIPKVQHLGNVWVGGEMHVR